MTDLTDKWKKGELPEGWYYVKGNRAEGIYAYTAEYLNHMYRPKNSDRIIERVPTFDEYQKLLSDQLAKNEAVEINAELEAENTKLKGLLKECQGYFEAYKRGEKCVECRGEFYNIWELALKGIAQVLGEE